MENIKQILITLVLSVALVLSGCQSNHNGLADPELTQNHSAEFFSKSGWQACAISAGVVGVGCYLISQDSKACAIAAVVSCGIAMGGNYYLDAKRAEYANTEQRLDAMINDVRKNTEQVQAVHDSAKKVLDKNLLTLRSLNQQIAQQTIDIKQAKTQLDTIDDNLKFLNEKLANMKTAEQDWRTISANEKEAGVDVARLDNQINQLNNQIKLLETQVELVSQQRSALRIS